MTVEAYHRAVEAAREVLGRRKPADLERQSGRALHRGVWVFIALRNPKAIRRLVAEAETDPDTDAACRDLASRYLKDGEDLPRPLLDWLVKRLGAPESAPRHTTRWHRDSYQDRDFTLRLAIFSVALAEPELAVTRNPANRDDEAAPTVCRAVHEAAKELGFEPPSVRRVEDIWAERDNAGMRKELSELRVP